MNRSVLTKFLVLLVIALLSGCDYFPYATPLVELSTGASTDRDAYTYVGKQRGIELSVEGYHQPHTFGWIELSTGWIGFKIRITNTRSEPVLVDPSNFILRSTKGQYSAQPYLAKPLPRNQVLTAPQLMQMAKQMGEMEPLLRTQLPPAISAFGGVEFESVHLSQDYPEVTLAMRLIGLESNEEIPIEIKWRVLLSKKAN